MTTCYTNDCNRRYQCAHFYMNKTPTEFDIKENFAEYTSFEVNNKKIKKIYYCGRKGRYKMFQPVGEDENSSVPS